MPCERIVPRLRCDLQQLVHSVRRATPVAGDRCCGSQHIDGSWLQLAFESDRAVIACHAPRAAGAGVALELAERVAALFRGHNVGRLGFGSPSVDLDGRDPGGFRAVVTVPFRRCDGACPSRPPPP